MRITIETDRGETAVATGEGAAVPSPQPAAGAPAVPGAPPPELLARAAELGALSAGPAPTPPAEFGAPMATIPAMAPSAPAAGPGDTPAGAAAPAPAEPEPFVVEAESEPEDEDE